MLTPGSAKGSRRVADLLGRALQLNVHDQPLLGVLRAASCILMLPHFQGPCKQETQARNAVDGLQALSICAFLVSQQAYLEDMQALSNLGSTLHKADNDLCLTTES